MFLPKEINSYPEITSPSKTIGTGKRGLRNSWTKKALPLVATSVVTALAFPAMGCAKDYLPEITKYSIPVEINAEKEFEVAAQARDDRGIKEVYIVFEDGTKLRTAMEKVDGEYKARLKLPSKGEYRFSIVAKDTRNKETVVKEKRVVYPALGSDEDKDGLIWEQEKKLGTDPNSSDTDRDGFTDWEEVVIYKTDPVIPNFAVRYAFSKNFDFYSTRVDIVKEFDKDGKMDDNERWLIDVMPDYMSFDKLVRVVQKDGKMDEVEREFFDLAIAYYPKVNELFQGFYGEIGNIPTLSTIEKEDIEAMKNILDLAVNPKYKSVFDSMWKEGIPGKRKFWTPLEALLWIAYDKKLDKSYLEYYSLERLINEAWKNTTTSNNYKSERWKDFEEVTGRLNSARLVSIYMVNNISYDYETYYKMLRGELYKRRIPQEVFVAKRGICTEQSAFALNNLLRNGYYYNNFDRYNDNAAAVLWARTIPHRPDKSHATVVYVENGVFWIIDNGKIRGSFRTLEEAAYATCSEWGEYLICNVDLRATKKVIK